MNEQSEAERMTEELEAKQDAAPKLEKPPGVTFDQQLVERLRPALSECFQFHGDMLRSVGVFFDWYGPFNDTAGTQKGMWFGPEGSVDTPDGVIGSAGACLSLLEEIFHRAFQLQGMARENLEVMLTEIGKASEKRDQLQKELEELQEQVEAKKAELGSKSS